MKKQDGREWKVNYTPLILWIALLVPVMLGASRVLEAFLKESDVIKGLLLCVSVYLNALFWLMERCDAAHWIAGTDWEALKDAGAARRKAYVRAHAKPFAWGMAALALWCAVSALTDAPMAVDVTAFLLSIVIPAFCCIRIRL